MTQTPKPLVIGLTGGIGMGKSTAAKILRAMGVPVHHADKAVHGLLRKGGRGVKPVGKLFPQALKNGAINRKILGQAVFAQPRKLKQLEGILHPLVRQEEQKFLQKARQKKAPAVVLEIPLLFETGAEKRCDTVFCVTAPNPVQRARVLARRGMTRERFRAILKRQMKNAKKCKKADYIIGTGKSLADTRRQLRRALDEVLKSGA